MMKIAMLTNNYKPFTGGVPISVERQAQELARRGHEVTVFAPEYRTDAELYREVEAEVYRTDVELYRNGAVLYEDDDVQNPVRVIRYKTKKYCMENGMVYPKMILNGITRVFEQETFDLIHTHHPMFVGPTALYLGKKYHIPVIYTYHTRYEEYLHYLPFFNDVGKFRTWKQMLRRTGQKWIVPAYMKWFTSQCDLVLAPTVGMQKQIRENGTNTAIAVLPTGLSEKFYLKYPEEARQIRRNYLEGMEDGYLFCTTGRLENEKNPEFLLKGIGTLKKYLKKPFRVLLIGDGSMRRKLEQEAKEMKIQEEVCFLGNVPNEKVNRYLQACDVFLFASKSETQGIVLAEAFAAGLPVVAVDGTGVEDIVVDGVNGFRTEENTDIWAGKVAEALQKRKQMQKQAWKTANEYRAVRLAVYEEMLYRQCIAAKSINEKEMGGYEEETDEQAYSAKHLLRLFKAS